MRFLSEGFFFLSNLIAAWQNYNLQLPNAIFLQKIWITLPNKMRTQPAL